MQHGTLRLGALAVALSTSALAHAQSDFNHDGSSDYARLGATESWVFLGKPDRTFIPIVQSYGPANYGNPSLWQTITGDFDADGHTDYARLGATYADVFLSNGDGTFRLVLHDYGGPNFGLPSDWQPITGDFDADGDTDYARLGPFYSHFYLSNGNGTFTPAVHEYGGPNFGLPSDWDPITGDFNADGATDYARLGPYYSHFYLSNGNGTFTSVQHDYGGPNFGLPSDWQPITGDFNADGATDYARLGTFYSHFYLSNGDGTFTPVLHEYGGPNFGLPSDWQPITGDFNADGATDYARLGAFYSHFYLSNGNGSFTAVLHEYGGPNFGLPSRWKPITGDFDRDGRTDYARLGATYAHVYYSRDDGGFDAVEQEYEVNFGLTPAWPPI